MIANPNVLTSWARAVYNPSDGTTLPATTTLTNLPAHADIIPSTSFHELPQNARMSVYMLMIDPGTDVVTGDQLLSATDIVTGDVWPNDYPSDPSQPGFGGTIWTVRFHHESSAGPGAYRALYVAKTQTTGPASPY